MQRIITDFMRQYQIADSRDGLIVGFSGGADSVCLLTCLWAWNTEEGRLPFLAVHVNHGIRGEAADEDEEFCRDFCQKRGIPFRAERVDAPAYSHKESLTLEEAGRKLRYEGFATIAKGQGMKRPAIAVAHHMDDQAETVLFHLCRGSRLRGAAGMQPIYGNIIRPLLSVRKTEILKFCKDRELSFCQDVTNEDNAYARNCIRNEVLPILEERINSQTVPHLAEAAEDFRESEDFLTELTREAYEKHCRTEEEGLFLTGLEKLHPYLSGRVIYQAIGTLLGEKKDLTHEQVERVKRLLSDRTQAGRTEDIRRGLMARKERDGLYLYFQKNPQKHRAASEDEEALPIPIDEEALPIPEDEEVLTVPDGRLKLTEIDWEKDLQIPNEVYTKFFDYAKINGDLRLRYREDGDYLVVDEEGHTKKLNRYFIDAGVPARKRDRIPVLADGSHIVWIIGDRIGYDVRISPETVKALKASYQKTEE